VNLEHSLRLGERPVTIPFARLNGDELHVRVLLGEPLLDVLDPLVLVGGAEARRDDRELALPTQDARRLVGECVADPLRRRLIDEEITRVRLRVGPT